MSNIFISHSSLDKTFVRKLATGLLAEGFPVWLDSWSLELGDSLVDEIYDGIFTSGAVLLTMSQSSATSGWVNRELNAALMKEQQSGRKFVIPIRVDGYQVPLKVADRLYVDFSSSFSAPLGVLVQALTKSGLRDIDVPPQRELLALSFTRAVHLDTANLNKALEHIERRQGCIQLTADQIVVNEDPEYEELLRRLHGRIDGIAAERFFTPALEAHLRSALGYIQERAQYLRRGVALMVSNSASSEAVQWFTHLVRAQAVSTLWSSQAPGAPDVLDYGEQWDCANYDDNHTAAEYFRATDLQRAVIWGSRKDVYGPQGFKFWIPSDQLYKLLSPIGAYLGPVAAREALKYPAFAKYVYPQIVLQAVHCNSQSIPWSLDDAWVGLM